MIHTVTQGSAGPWIVFVHGFACDHGDWQHQIDALSDGHRCLSVDLRGHGQSKHMGGPFDMRTLATDVVEAMRANRVEAAVLVGHSMGTRVVAEALATAPDLVRALVFVDGSRLGQGDPDAARTTITKLIDTLGYEHIMRANFAAMFNDDADPAMRDAVVARAADLDEPVGRALWAELVTYDAAHMDAAYKAIQVPLMVVQSSTVEVGGQRRSLEPGETDIPFLALVKRLTPHADVVVAPHTGHFIQLEAPDLVTRSIRSIAGQVYPTRSSRPRLPDQV